MQEAPPPRPWWRRGKSWARIARDLASLAAAAALLFWGLPWVADVSWAEIVEPLRDVSPLFLLLLAGLQLAALLAFTFTITGALPGITHRQALTVNLAGSLVANVLPFGGALALGATYAICRSWGFTRSAIGISIVLGGVFSSAGKVLVPLVGLIALTLQSGPINPAVRDAALIGVITLLAVLGVFVAMLVSATVARVVGRGIEAAAEGMLRLVGRRRTLGWDTAVERLRKQTRGVMRTGWVPMTFGTVGYFAIYFVLFWMCMQTVGLVAGVGTLIAAYALGRLLTSVAVTPGGLGLVEAGTVALLVAMGADPAKAAGGALLFTIFTHIIEIPFGVIAWLAWGFGRRRRGVPVPRITLSADGIEIAADPTAATTAVPVTPGRNSRDGPHPDAGSPAAVGTGGGDDPTSSGMASPGTAPHSGSSPDQGPLDGPDAADDQRVSKKPR